MDETASAAVAMRAAEAWGGFAAPPRPIPSNGGRLYLGRDRRDRLVALRLHAQTPGAPAAAILGARALLAERLADAGFPCPWPLRTAERELVWQPESGGPLATMRLWLDGPCLAERSDPAAAGLTATQSFRDLGSLLADLHLTADTLGLVAPPGAPPPVSARAVQGIRDGGAVRPPSPARASAESLAVARTRATAWLEAAHLGADGLIHGAPAPWRIIALPDGLYLTGIGGCTTGPRLDDAAALLAPLAGSRAYGQAAAALHAGYAEAGGPLDDAGWAVLPALVFLHADAALAQPALAAARHGTASADECLRRAAADLLSI